MPQVGHDNRGFHVVCSGSHKNERPPQRSGANLSTGRADTIVADLKLPSDPEFDAALSTFALSTIKNQITVRYSARLRSSLAVCYAERKLIHLNRALQNFSAELVRVTLIHELAHLSVYMKHGRAVRPHGLEWRALMRGVGYPAETCMKIAPELAVRFPTQSRRRIVHACIHCGWRRVSGRRCSRWRCRQCLEAGRSGVLAVSEESVGRPSRRAAP